jgi:hypothetical protein
MKAIAEKIISKTFFNWTSADGQIKNEKGYHISESSSPGVGAILDEKFYRGNNSMHQLQPAVCADLASCRLAGLLLS